MNGIPNRRAAHNREKSFPGCMGKMVNLFDFGPGMTGNKLLMDKAHRDGSLFPSNQPYVVKKTLDPIGAQIEDKQVKYDLRTSSNKRSNGTPMKMLIEQEMSKGLESKQKPPNVVARLMGLDALPEKHPNSTAQRSQPNSFSQITQSGPLTSRQQQDGFLDKQMRSGIHPFLEQHKYKDVYEVWERSPKTNNIKDKSPQKGRYTENKNEAKMDLVRKKFIEAKRLATDEKLRQSKEFQDAVEVLSSNKDLFLKFLQEPNSLFSQHLYELQSIPPPPQTKRITVLRPSKTMENNGFVGLEKTSEKQIPKQNRKDDSPTQSTRIVVLKPSPRKTPDIKAVVSSPPSSSPRLLYCEESEDDEARCSRDVAKDESTQQTSESFSSHQREETLLSSVFSNGYVGDESSFNRSDNAYIGEENVSDSEVMTPTSRYSWDYHNRFDSPYSSSFSRASYSPESSVCREAKKRLSERWAMMASNGTTVQEQRQVRRSSSTLGEMLALSDTKQSTRFGEESIRGIGFLSSRSCGGEQDLSNPTLCLSGGQDNDGREDSPRNLLRSRSVPVSSTTYGARLNVEVPDPEVGKTSVPKEVEKPKSGKSSFKGKVSSLFFLRNRKTKTNKEKQRESRSAGSRDKFQSAIVEIPEVSEKTSAGTTSDGILECVANSDLERGSLLTTVGPSSKTSSPASTCVQPKQGTFCHEAILSLEKPGTQSENQDQPSPNSVLEAPFEEDNMTPQPCGKVKSDLQGPCVDLQPLKSNLIAKSPPIETLARSLSWDEACSEVVTPDPLNPIVLSEAREEQEWLLFIQTLLSSATLDREEHSHSDFSRWHSLESPLDPLLIEKFVNPENNKEKWHEAKCRHRRSKQKLIFDCVNAALVEIIGGDSNSSSTRAQKSLSIGSPVTAEEVWGRVREWFSSEEKFCFSGESGDDIDNVVVETVVKKEVGGRGWVELMRLEVDEIGKEIEGKMLEDLMEEALFELTGRLC